MKQADPRLPESLEREPYRYRFFQAVRLLQYLRPERRPVGRFFDIHQESIRFRANTAVGFPASEVQSLSFPEDAYGETPPSMEVNFLGLHGPTGELPLMYRTYVRQRERDGDGTLRDFLDIFNHRLTSLFYRAWEKYRFTVKYERGEGAGLAAYMLDLVGLGTRGLQNRQEVEDESLLFYAGLLAQMPRSAVALESVLADYFGVDVEIQQFVGMWRGLERDAWTHLQEDDTGDIACYLGGGAVAGNEVWDPQSIVRIRMGPLPLHRYLEFLPNGRAYRPLKAITRFFAGEDLDFEVQLLLKRTETPACGLGTEGPEAPQLGWVTWVKSKPMDRDPGETILRLWNDEQL